MKYKLILLLGLFLAGCADPFDEHASITTVEASVQTSSEEKRTRTADDGLIGDVNFYLFTPEGTLVHHFFTDSQRSLRFECPSGRYRFYVVANYGSDMGNREESAVQALQVACEDSYDALPMSAFEEIDIPRTAGVFRLDPIQVRRNVARIEYDIRIDAALKNAMILEEVRYVNLPAYGTPFSDVPPQTFYDSEAFDADPSAYSGTFYLFPNEQGTVPTIQTQRQRNEDNAPAHATYIQIFARYNETRKVSYVVYLGENNTTDFNVRPNQVQVLSITIKGIDAVDTRMDSYILDHVFDPDRIGDYCIPGTLGGYFMLRGGKTDKAVTARYEWLEGDASHATFQVAGDAVTEFPLLKYKQTFYRFSYAPQIITPMNCRTHHRFVVTDYMDHATSYDVPIRWANKLTVRCQGGTVRSPDALAQELQAGLVRFACMEECRLRAVAPDSCVFEGWYRDYACKDRIASGVEYAHRMTKVAETVYARFVPRQVLIYTEVDTVDFACDNPYTVDRERRAFRVPLGSVCTICTRPTSYIAAWYDSYHFESANWLGFAVPYTFTATEDRTIAPKYFIDHPLDTSGTANCYTFSGEALRSFDATVQGNGRATKNIVPRKIVAGAKAVVLWHTDTSSPVKQVCYRDGRIYFVTVAGGTGANAVIGLLDAGGAVLWSWNIWRTADPDANAQTYPDGRTFMDRNLGSTGARTSNGEAVVSGYGLYYQWGRKDPFIYPNRYCEARPCIDAFYAEGFGPQQTSFSSATTPDWAAAHPTTFINGSELWHDWLSRPNKNLWGNPATTVYDTGGKSVKTIYDPCPPGWKVPDEGAWTDDAFYITDFNGVGYMFLATSSLNKYYYPAGGYLLKGSFVGVDTQAAYWTDSPALVSPQAHSYSEASRAMTADKSGMTKTYGSLRRDAGAMIRCQKE